MSSLPFAQGYPARGPFSPRFLLPEELTQYGLPDANRQPNILALVDMASTAIDIHCGRIDGNGNGSLVYSTYMERLQMQSPGRNITKVSFKPLYPVTQSTVNLLMASANNTPTNPSSGQVLKSVTNNPLMFRNYFWTGVQANTTPISGVPESTISPILGCSGRYGYTRRSQWMIYPDLNYGINPLQIASFFGGPPNWTVINLSLSDFDPQTGEIWVPAGLYLSQYTEIVVIYNSGYHPLYMPMGIKQATAALTKNLLATGGGTTGLRRISAVGTPSIGMANELIDDFIDRILQPFKTVIAF